MEQDQLSKLLEAANILQIKGLYESTDSEEKPTEESHSPNIESDVNKATGGSKDPEMALTGSQKRKKRKSTSSSAESLSTLPDNRLSKKVLT